MKRLIAILLAVLIAGGVTAVSDEIWVDRLRYSGVEIVGVEGGQLVFLLNGNRVAKPIKSITRIQAVGVPGLTKAEALLAEGKFDEAMAAYQAAAAVAAAPWQKRLLEQRRLLAEHRKAQLTSKPAANPVAPAAKRCYWCGGTEWMACPECRAGNVNTGQGKCPECAATGYVSCPDCEGRSCQSKCKRCKGAGKTVVRTVRSGAFERKIVGPCPNCKATGYEDSCDRCCKDDRKTWGKVLCFACKGIGRYGDCPRCKGNKKVPCNHCEAGKKRAGEFAGIATTQPTDPKIFRILSAPKAFVKNWPKQPDYSKMTTIQWAMAAREYTEKTSKIRKQLLGREVRWLVRIEDVKPVKDTEDFAVIGVSPGKARVHVIFKKDKLEMLAKLRKGRHVTVVGAVALWPPSDDEKGSPPTLVGPNGQIRLVGKAIEAPKTD